MIRKIAFFKNADETNTAPYIGTIDGEIVFAHRSLVQIIDGLSLERLPLSVWLRWVQSNDGKANSLVAYPNLKVRYDRVKPKAGFASSHFLAFVDSQNFCFNLNGLSHQLSRSLKRFNQRLSMRLVFDRIDQFFPIDRIEFFVNSRFNHSYVNKCDASILSGNDPKYNIVPIRRNGKKTDLDAPICDQIYSFADEPTGQGLLVLTGDGDYSFAIKTWLRKNPGGRAACVAISRTVSPELIELANLDNFDLLQIGVDPSFFDACWVQNTHSHN